jgi:hypothetical protein
MTTTVDASVQTVERRVANLIHSDFTTRGKVSRTPPSGWLPWADVTVDETKVVVLIGSRLPCWTARPVCAEVIGVAAGRGPVVLDRALRQGHVLEGADHGRELVQHQLGSRGDLTDRLGCAAGNLEPLRGSRGNGDPGPGTSPASRFALGLHTRTVVPAARVTMSATGASASTRPWPTTMM